MYISHFENHYTTRIGWLRAAVLGANDGIVSMASLVLGIAAANVGRDQILLTGVAGLVAGAMSMAAGEYVSVSSQADVESAELIRERYELDNSWDYERAELTELYIERGLEPELAQQVADKLMAHDALAAHARDELGLSGIHQAKPIQAAFVSATTFAAGAALPLGLMLLIPPAMIVAGVATGSLVCLAFLGALAARAGGAKVFIGAGRVTLWGAVAMMATAAVGHFFGVVA
ncbi:VIT family protein [Crenothrix sp.]|uniref:VIT1/CCC1 transporter family protein n=1 Tax=Crenothrix sp. TaxID=3100433 RepID=UPI00374DF110